MKKKIGVFACGWGGEYLENILKGIHAVGSEKNADVFAFVNFSVIENSRNQNIPEINFFTLPDLDEFDGLVLLANSFNAREERDYFKNAVASKKIPTVTVEYRFDTVPNVDTSNYSGMHDLAEHMVTVHGSRDIVFIGGPEDHPESNERLRALRDVLLAHGLELPQDNVLYANWSPYLIEGLVKEWKEKHKSYPDTFICANDTMAMALIDYLKKEGIRVPDDVMVTGFDYINNARFRIPSITSVSHEWDVMGRKAAENLFMLIAGEKPPMQTTIDTRFIPGGTCGCKHYSFLDNEDGTYVRIVPENQVDNVELDKHFRHFFSSVRKASNLREVYRGYSHLFEGDHPFEGDYFRICLDTGFFRIKNGMQDLLKTGNVNAYSAICRLNNGMAEPYARLSRHDAIFGAAESREETDIYLFVPLHSDGYTYGFAMFNGTLKVVSDNLHYIWIRHMAQSLEQVSSNILLADMHDKLMMQSVTDALTGTYNRTGCRNIIYPKLIDWTKQGGKSVIMLVDVDRMKMINDKFGHASGDEALCIITDLFVNKLPEEFMISRFGGDEFLICGTLSEPYEDIQKLVDKLEEALSEKIGEENIQYPLTVSIGYSVTAPETTDDIEHGIETADANMYEVKHNHHNK